MYNESALAQSYNLDPEANVWLRKDAAPFNYSDGDSVENAIGEMLAGVKDRSVLSDELRALQTNWPTLYYFSASRSSLLRALEEKLLADARVLELGCGMGAVTRYLGETAAEVIAVEGSRRRGSIAALRCADLPNVHVLVDEIKSLPAQLGKFDVVILIGVLEYACRYGGPGADMEVLKKARSFLKPDGFLVLAIENKLGLKYLGGVPEDHLGRSWVGVTNGYADNGVRTWSRAELQKLLSAAGFKYCQQFIPLPDYKLPSTIITPAGLQTDPGELNLGPILNNCRRYFEAPALFNAGEAWQSVYDAGLLPDLADSLCFVASVNRDIASPFAEGELVNHYGNLGYMAKKFSKQVKIKRENGQITVRRERLSGQADAADTADGKIAQVLEDEPYHNGELLSSIIRKVTMRPDWTVDELFQAFEPWVRVLRENADENLMCDGKFLDFMPFNIIMIDGKPQAFDQEWVAKDKLSLAFLLYRGLANTITRILPLRRSSRHNAATLSELINEYMKRQNFPESVPTSLDYLWWQETKLMMAVRGDRRFRGPKDYPLQYMKEI